MIASGKIVLQRDGEREYDAYLARPAGAGPGSRPSIMIFTEMFGMGQHNRDMAEDFARRGHYVTDQIPPEITGYRLNAAFTPCRRRAHRSLTMRGRRSCKINCNLMNNLRRPPRTVAAGAKFTKQSRFGSQLVARAGRGDVAARCARCATA